LALQQRPLSRWSRVKFSLLTAGIGLLLAGGCFALAAFFFWLGEGSMLENQTWTALVIDFVLVFWFWSGLIGVLICEPLIWLTIPKSHHKSKWDRFYPVLMAALVICFSAVGYAYAHDRSIFDLGLWAELTALAGALTFFILGACLLVIAALLVRETWRDNFRIEIDLRQGCVEKDESDYRFPKPQCATREIVAVQVLSGIEQASSFFQVNLVLDNTNRPRLNLAEYPAAASAREVGSSVADFLHAPLVDQVQAEK
jgi:hypothetical protein